ncbi:MAG: hypothetical protein CTY22_04835 [Methylomonas sp.]|nr:MAG: hypothetical protein CTY23_08280 [Methylomonas sp.]PPD26578.1 MAG: hypothetical protein CTY22_04835 [Methylomonas sp.]PPD38373.1 MAG: hypothetical protein CTY21_04830 [Methylomonas sp.]PPD42835.1 MAG: hypothetical protein CTY17_00630 [Methylomonas sp.]PPD56011.1 MAG: hypothetical protein CTY11_00320 [Methylomonas sp.]
MKHLVKAAAVAALLMGAGAANASVQNIAGDANETFLMVYDQTRGFTFNFDTGITYGYWAANSGTANAWQTSFGGRPAVGSSPSQMPVKTFDFSNDANWNRFMTGMTDAGRNNLRFMVVVGNQLRTSGAVTSQNPLPEVDTFNNFSIQKIELHAGEVSSSLGFVRPELNVSTFADDRDAPFRGQYRDSNSMWSTWPASQQFEGGYGEAKSVKFWLAEYFFFWDEINDPNADRFISKNSVVELGKWTLAGNSLTFTPVPVPAAVWMFGTGLLGLLGISRRKAA